MTAHTAVLSGDALLQSLRTRYATKKFDTTRTIPEATWQTIRQAMVLAPSSYGLQPWRFVDVVSKDVRQKLRAAAYNQGQITDASHLVVLARRDRATEADVQRYIERIMQVRGVPMTPDLAGFRDTMVKGVQSPATLPGGSMETYTRSQVYIALGFGLSAAAMLGVDACPMEGFNPQQFDEILGLPALGYRACVVGAFGYRSPDDWLGPLKKVRFEESDVFMKV